MSNDLSASFQDEIRQCIDNGHLGAIKARVKAAYQNRELSPAQFLLVKRRIESRYTEILYFPFTSSV